MFHSAILQVSTDEGTPVAAREEPVYADATFLAAEGGVARRVAVARRPAAGDRARGPSRAPARCGASRGWARRWRSGGRSSMR